MKKMIAMLLTFSLALGLAACQTADTNTGSAREPSSGNTGDVLVAENQDSLLTMDTITFTLALTENSAQPIQENSLSFQVVREKTGVTLQPIIIPSTDYETKMSALFASNDLPDFFKTWGSDTMIMEMVEAGALLGLKELVAQYAPTIANDYETIENLDRKLIDGEIYTLPTLRRDTNYEKGCVPFLRVDLLEKNDLSIPATWAEWTETMKALMRIYPDIIPYGARGDGRLIVDKLGPTRSMGAEYDLYMIGDGSWKFGRIQPEYKEFVIFVNGLVNDGILDNEYLTTSLQTLQEGLASGKYIFWYDNPTFAPAINEALQANDPSARFAPIPILENGYGERVNYKHPDHYFNVYAISSKVADPQLAVRLWDWFYSDEGTLALNYGAEGATYEMIDGTPQWKQEILDKYLSQDNSFYAIQSDYGLGDLCFTPSWLFTAFDEFRQTGEGTIDSLYIHEFYKDDPAIVEQPVQPPLTAEESARILEIRQRLDDSSRTEINRFIMGERPLDEYDAYVESMIQSGAQELEDILNRAEQRYRQG